MISLWLSEKYLLYSPCFLAAEFRSVNCLTGLGFPAPFLLPGLYLGFFLGDASFLPFMVASFFTVASFSLDHCSRLRLLFKVPILTLCFSAKALKVILLVSHSDFISSQLITSSTPPPYFHF